MKLIAELDGNALCIKREDFINLQESPAVFIDLKKEEYFKIKKLEEE